MIILNLATIANSSAIALSVFPYLLPTQLLAPLAIKALAASYELSWEMPAGPYEADTVCKLVTGVLGWKQCFLGGGGDITEDEFDDYAVSLFRETLS